MIPIALAFFVSVGAGPSQVPQVFVEPSVFEALEASPSQDAYVLVVLDKSGLGVGAAREEAIDARRKEILASLAEDDFRPVYQWPHVAGFSGYVSSSGLETLSRHRFVARIGSDFRGRAQLGSAVSFIGASEVHSVGFTGEGVTVAVLDSGIDTNHPDLVGDIEAGGMRFLQQGANVGTNVEDVYGHGTSVSGIITGDGVVAPAGAAPDAKILPIQVLDGSGSGWLSDWVTGLDYVITVSGLDPNLSVINMSLVSNQRFSECGCDNVNASNMLLQDAIQTARAAGMLTFVSSGNGGNCNAMGSPACLTDAIAVAAVYESDLGREPNVGSYSSAFGSSFGNCFDATTAADQLTCFSDLSGCNDLAAPGRLIVGPTVGGGQGPWTGTSQACPLVVGTLALLIEATGDDPEALLNIMRATGKPTTGNCGTGPSPVRVDAILALDAATAFESYCFGNGGDQAGCTNCPCGNNAAASEVGGCINSAGMSGRLTASGEPQVSGDTLRFEAVDLPAMSAGVLLSSMNRLPTNPANPCFGLDNGIPNQGDGLRCAGGAQARHGLRFSDGAGDIGQSNAGWGGGDAPPVGLIGQGGFVAGQTRHFQLIYRDLTHGPCTAELASTQGMSVIFRP